MITPMLSVGYFILTIGACPLNFLITFITFGVPILWTALPILSGSIPVVGTRTQRVWRLFVMTGEGRIIG